jgi:hypothetical protein
MRDIFSDVTPKRHTSGKAERPKPADVDDLLAASPFILERAMTGLSRALKGKHFDRAGGADAYINKLLGRKSVPRERPTGFTEGVRAVAEHVEK